MALPPEASVTQSEVDKRLQAVIGEKIHQLMMASILIDALRAENMQLRNIIDGLQRNER